ncbi:GNAT family N-acetyltransferase [Streptomyces sp. NPDC019507]|uniref:GNAT family N-acetyltransferase n=1 Tax=Streptomyces sp. NPDC019507 TaxID=3154689 RepID=UPI0033CD2F0A
MARTELVPFDVAHAATVAGWPATSGEVAMWCGRHDFPLAARVVARWQAADDVRAHALLRDGELVAYGQLWFDAEEDEVELARLIVSPAVRARGIGRELVRRLTAAARDAGHEDVFMRVHPQNEPALRCYRHASFLPVDPHLAAAWNAAQPVDYVWLRHCAAAGTP